MRILLGYRCGSEGRSSDFERLLPVGLCSLGAVLRRGGHEASLANFSAASRREVERHLLSVRPDLVGISVFTFNRSASFELAQTVRRLLPAATIVAGGPHASHLHASILRGHPEIDYVVIGEGERTLTELVDRIEEGREAAGLAGLAWRRNGAPESGGWPEPIEDLDRLPLPFEGFSGFRVDPRAQFMVLVSSRGCPARCAFCNTPEYWGSRIRFRSVRHVLEELGALREEYGLLEVSFRDDTFTVDRGRILDLCGRMNEARLGFLWDCQSRVNAVDEERLVAMRRAGCVHIQYGVESGSSRLLKRLAKGIGIAQIEAAARATRRVGLEFSVYLITGIDGEEEQDLAATEALVRRIRPHGAVVSPLAVFPGTRIWDEWKRGHGLTDEAWGGELKELLYVREGGGASAAAVKRIGRLVSREAPRNAYGLTDLREQRRRIGDCYALDVAEASLLRARGRLEDARSVLERLAVREPWNPWAPLTLGRLHLQAGRLEKAVAGFREAAASVPRQPAIHSLLGQALARLGRKGAAERAFRRALTLDPGNGEARLGLRRLSGARASGRKD